MMTNVHQVWEEANGWGRMPLSGGSYTISQEAGLYLQHCKWALMSVLTSDHCQ